MPEFRITIGPRPPGPGLPAKPPGKLETVKAAVLGFVALACVIGVLLAAFVIGSIIAALLLLVLAIVFIVWFARRMVARLRQGKPYH